MKSQWPFNSLLIVPRLLYHGKKKGQQKYVPPSSHILLRRPTSVKNNLMDWGFSHWIIRKNCTKEGVAFVWHQERPCAWARATSQAVESFWGERIFHHHTAQCPNSQLTTALFKREYFHMNPWNSMDGALVFMFELQERTDIFFGAIVVLFLLICLHSLLARFLVRMRSEWNVLLLVSCISISSEV